jgi:hypothetical protein
VLIEELSASQSTLNTQQSPISNLQSAISNQQSLQSTISNQQSAILSILPAAIRLEIDCRHNAGCGIRRSTNETVPAQRLSA